MRLACVLGVLIALPSLGVAQSVDCSNPVTQVDMNMCAPERANTADVALNRAYQIAIAQARRLDTFNPSVQPSNEDLLRQAQRAWIPFRDAACTAEASLARGGTMASLLYSTCVEKLTRRRTEDLLFYGESN